jgi:vancomycin resistance protein YoaR
VYFGVTPSGDYVVSLVSGRIENALKALAGQVDRAPRNASFRTAGGRVVGVVAGLNGRRLDPAATAARVDDVLTAQGSGSPPPRVDMVVASTSPNLTTAEAEAFAPRMRSISAWTTPFVPGIKNFFGKNIAIPTSKIDGYVLAPGESFDFWQAVGDVSRAAGYGDGGAIINGRTEPTGALAGGICSCSTTLFNAAARAGLELGARRNHYYYINRYPKGLDATVFKSSSGSTQTMSFRNDTPYPILIRGINGYGTVTFQLYSVPNGRTTRFSTPIVKNFRPASDTVVYTSALRPGQRERIEYPVDGFDAWVTRTVTDKSGTVIHQETFYSHYARVTGIVRVGR